MALRPEVRCLALCAGIGGLERGVAAAFRAFDEVVRVVCWVERDSFAASVLVARMGADVLRREVQPRHGAGAAPVVPLAGVGHEALDCAPVWDDVATFDGRPWRGRVDLISAGVPCQPFSSAGKHTGVADERWIWPEVLRVIREVGPRWVAIENVPPIRKHGLRIIVEDLARLGFSSEWGLLRASEVGAPHRRERLFLLADADAGRRDARVGDDVRARRDESDALAEGAGLADADRDPEDDEGVDEGRPRDRGRGTRVADAARERRPEGDGGLDDARGRAGADRDGAAVADADGAGSEGRRRPGRRGARRKIAPAGGEGMADAEHTRRSERSENDDADRGDAPGSHADGCDSPLPDAEGEPVRVEPERDEPGSPVGGDAEPRDDGHDWPPGPGDDAGWLAYLASGGAEPVLRRGADGVPEGMDDRADRLRVLGNAVVEAQARAAFVELRRRLGEDVTER